MKKLLIALLIVFSMISIAAAESKSYTISCTIPAIPGVNAPPLLEQKTVQNVPEINMAQRAETANEAVNNAVLPTVQKEESNQIQLANGETKTMTVQTFYSR